MAHKLGTDQRRAHGSGAVSYAHSRDTGIGGTDKSNMGNHKSHTIVARPSVESGNPGMRQRAGMPKPATKIPMASAKG